MNHTNYYNRKFNETAGNRHIPQCQNIRSKPKVLLQGSSHIATTFRTEKTRIISRNSRNSFDQDMKKTEIDLRAVINDITKPSSASSASRFSRTTKNNKLVSPSKSIKRITFL